MKAKISLVVLGVFCLVLGMGFAVFCYAQYRLELGAVMIGLVFAGAASAIISAGLTGEKVCAKCGAPLTRKRRQVEPNDNAAA
jgi:hypothetical protein